ncbi:hypothetical protein E2562_008038 [Oryza meyeriana var. granulata]|uniref:Uncharacterized protein n=1 Tax=Oryza meyeriana var. granulata TaxID=110450 RepID=A0A6G1DGE6_9ORYZ|nr:hypothetical protein E2562_008038 [Oryza meyeriana var. granulata]
MTTKESISFGSALCVTTLVESNNWRFAANELVNDVCLKVSGALEEAHGQTVAHLNLVVALSEQNPLTLEPYGRSILHAMEQFQDDNMTDISIAAFQASETAKWDNVLVYLEAHVQGGGYETQNEMVTHYLKAQLYNIAQGHDNMAIVSTTTLFLYVLSLWPAGRVTGGFFYIQKATGENQEKPTPGTNRIPALEPT